ncbi:MAG: site-specific DNA-methyltransferase, partial [Anaerolineae bacterium]
MADQPKKRAPRNRTITLSHSERARYQKRLLRLDGPAPLDVLLNRTICQDVFDVLDLLPAGAVDL